MYAIFTSSVTVGSLRLLDLSVKYVPEWFPGAGFKRKAREWSIIADQFGSIPFDFVKESMRNGTAVPSFTSIALRDIKETDDKDYQERLIKGLAATMYTGMTTIHAEYRKVNKPTID